MTVEQVMFKNLEAKVRSWIVQHEKEEAHTEEKTD